MREWACIEFKFDVDPNSNSLNRRMANENRIWEMAGSAAAETKSVGSVTSIKIEEKLRIWVLSMWEEKVNLTKNMVQEKGSC